MTSGIKGYLIFWAMIIVCVILGILFPKFANSLKRLNWRYRANEGKFPNTLPDEKPSLLWLFFKLIVVFILGYCMVYYNWLGMGAAFACGKGTRYNKNSKCYQKYKAEIENRKQSKSTTAGKKTSTRKVVKNNKR